MQTIGEWVIYKNNQLIGFNKPAGLPVQSDQTGDKSLLQLAEIYAKTTLYLIHRIDRPVSGVVLFARQKKAVGLLSEQFRERSVQKTYLAVVKEKPAETAGTLRHWLVRQGKNNRSIAVEEGTPGSSLSELHYTWMASSDHYHLLQIEPVTGRHHQIRAQLAAIGCPVKGDVKYGARRSNPDRSIHLHAWKLSFVHPISGERENITADLPEDPVWSFFGQSLNG